MVAANKPTIALSCKYYKKENPKEPEIKTIIDGVNAAATSTGVDPRIILVMIMQESNGCPRVPTTESGATATGASVTNPGLMQTHKGISCTEHPCPKEKIHKMVMDGTIGTDHGKGIKPLLDLAEKKFGATGAQRVYVAVRLYNSGESLFKKGDDLSAPASGTKSYSSDIANRLMGWVKP